jgi:hypothetical protein
MPLHTIPGTWMWLVGHKMANAPQNQGVLKVVAAVDSFIIHAITQSACMLTLRNRSGINHKCLRWNGTMFQFYLSHVINIPQSQFRNIDAKSKLLSIAEAPNISRFSCPASSLLVLIFGTFAASKPVLSGCGCSRSVTCRKSTTPF